MVATLVRLRWRLTLNAIKSSTLALVGTAIGAFYAVGALAALLGGAVALGAGAPAAAAPVLAGLGALTCIGWVLIPMLMTGVDSTLDPRAMAAWTAPSRPLALGLVAAGALGLPGVVTGAGFLLAVLVWALAGQWAAALLALVMAPAALATCVLLSRIVVIGAGVSTSRRGRDIVGMIGIVVVLAVSLMPSLVNAIIIDQDGIDLAAFASIATVLGYTPFGWALAAPGLMAQGQTGLALLLGLGALVLPVALFPLWERVTARVMTGPARTATRSQSYEVSSGDHGGPGVRVLPWQERLARLVPGAAAGVAARCLRYWRTDPRYMSVALGVVLMPVIFSGVAVAGVVTGSVAIYGPDGQATTVSLAPGQGPAVLLGVPLGIALLGGWGLHDDLAFDSTALWTHITAGVRGRDDRLGRVLAAALWQLPLIMGLTVLAGAWTGLWAAAPAVLGACCAIYGSAQAWASVSSVLLPYEANPPGENPLKSRTSGMAILAALVQMVGLLVIIVLSAPVLAGLLAMALSGSWTWSGALLLLGLAWGAGAVWGGVVLGGRLLEAREVSVLTTIRGWAGHEETR